MSNIIENYYAQAPINPFILKQKMKKFSRNPDIQEEFEYWIKNRKFTPKATEINGYTAEMLAALSEYLRGEGAFLLMIELREHPEKALNRIQKGFYML